MDKNTLIKQSLFIRRTKPFDLNIATRVKTMLEIDPKQVFEASRKFKDMGGDISFFLRLDEMLILKS